MGRRKDMFEWYTGKSQDMFLVCMRLKCSAEIMEDFS